MLDPTQNSFESAKRPHVREMQEKEKKKAYHKESSSLGRKAEQRALLGFKQHLLREPKDLLPLSPAGRPPRFRAPPAARLSGSGSVSPGPEGERLQLRKSLSEVAVWQLLCRLKGTQSNQKQRAFIL